MGRLIELDDYRECRRLQLFHFHDEVVATVDGDHPVVVVTDDDTGDGLCMTRADARRLCAALLVAIQRVEDVE